MAKKETASQTAPLLPMLKTVEQMSKVIVPRCFLYAFRSSGHHSGTTAYIFYE